MLVKGATGVAGVWGYGGLEDVNGSAPDCCNSSASAVELPQSCAKPSMWWYERTPAVYCIWITCLGRINDDWHVTHRVVFIHDQVMQYIPQNMLRVSVALINSLQPEGAFTLALSEHLCLSQCPSPWPSFVYTTSKAGILGYPRPWPFW